MSPGPCPGWRTTGRTLKEGPAHSNPSSRPYRLSALEVEEQPGFPRLLSANKTPSGGVAGSQAVGLGDVKNHKGTPQLWLSTQSPLPGTVHHAMPSLLCPDGLQKEKKKSYEETIPVFYKASQGWSRALTYNPGFHPQNHPPPKEIHKTPGVAEN